ncbi:Putative F-box/LRR-repeat protein At5g02930 [Linum grandiflorum]
MDRLSDLHDGILHHILSFLDTKSSVGTIVFSRRWTSVWKCVPVLTFSEVSTELGLKQHVNQVLSLRSDSNVRKITIEFPIDDMKMDLFDKIMKYAASHDVQHLSLGRISHRLLLQAIVSICTCYQSLKVLELHGVYLNETVVGSWSRLQKLETLALNGCFFDGNLDMFADFPRLESLKLITCASFFSGSTLKISGLQLLNLEISRSSFTCIEIVTPKLQSFCFENRFCSKLKKFSKLDLPSLNHATIVLLESPSSQHHTLIVKQLANFFDSLYNVQSLNLRVDTFEVCSLPFSDIKLTSFFYCLYLCPLILNHLFSIFLYVETLLCSC